jgi:antitoxin ParD1/3/4
MMQDGGRAVLDRDAVLEKWLREEVAAGVEEYRADPSKGIPADRIKEHVRGEQR